jgi:hypothetical protein
VSVCRARCHRGWKAAAGAQTLYTCALNGTWVGGSLECVREEMEWLPYAAAAAVAMVCLCWCGLVFVCRSRCGAAKQTRADSKLLTKSLLGGSAMMPEAMLTRANAMARWNRAEARGGDTRAELAAAEDVEQGRVVMAVAVADGTVGVRGPAPAPPRHRQPKGEEGSQLQPVMFRNEHVGELRPREWSSASRCVGVGTYATVHRVEWRGRAVALKAIRLPAEPHEDASKHVRQDLKQQMRQIVHDFTTEVEICCDLNHPNLVRLLGYSTEPRLLLMQELMAGRSLDHQVSDDPRRPSPRLLDRQT